MECGTWLPVAPITTMSLLVGVGDIAGADFWWLKSMEMRKMMMLTSKLEGPGWPFYTLSISHVSIHRPLS